MLRKRAVLVALMLMFIVGCATGQTPTVQQYNFLNGAADVRLAVLQGADSYYTLGMLDEETKDKIIQIDKAVQAAGKLATAKLNEVVMLEKLQALDPESVTPEQMAAAMKAYLDAKTAFRANWSQMTLLVDPFLMKWMQEAAAKEAEGG
jgi:imidazolonepropionase-like amidohydrolase